MRSSRCALDYALSQEKLVLANWIQKFKVADLVVVAKEAVTCKDLAAWTKGG